MIRSLRENKFIRFAIVGCMNTLNYYILYLFLFHVVNFHYFFAHVGAFLFSMVGSFFLNSYFTFKSKPTWKKFIQFPLTYVTNLLMSTIGMFLFIELFHFNETISPILAAVFAIPFTFLMSKWILDK